MPQAAPSERPQGEIFRRFAHASASRLGSPWAFVAALALIVGWALTGPIFGFADAWQLVINTGTTIVTFLMVFLIQATQNRDSKAVHLKLDELIRSSKARDAFADLEDASEDEIEAFQREFEALRKKGVHGRDAVRGASEHVRQRGRRG
jgi:low affinity Fe/Cu permease